MRMPSIFLYFSLVRSSNPIGLEEVARAKGKQAGGTAVEESTTGGLAETEGRDQETRWTRLPSTTTAYTSRCLGVHVWGTRPFSRANSVVRSRASIHAQWRCCKGLHVRDPGLLQTILRAFQRCSSSAPTCHTVVFSHCTSLLQSLLTTGKSCRTAAPRMRHARRKAVSTLSRKFPPA